MQLQNGEVLVKNMQIISAMNTVVDTRIPTLIDPESKGKIENVVKYVKQNFLYNRCFCDIATLNEEVLQWLNRTAISWLMEPPRYHRMQHG